MPRAQAQNLQAPYNVQLVGSPWDNTPALDKGMLIGGGATFLLGSVLGLSGQRLGAKIAFGVTGAMALALTFLALKGLGNDNVSALEIDMLAGAGLSASVIAALFILGRDR